MGKPVELPPAEVLREKLSYNQSTGVLTWSSGPRAGVPAGYVDTQRTQAGGRKCVRLRITYNGKCRSYLASRLAWKIVTGQEPPVVVDHEDHDATNNAWANLRNGSGGTNQRNRKIACNNRSGVTGVSFDKHCGKWVAHIHLNGRYKNLGRFAVEDLDLAAMEVLEARYEAGFHPTHGL